MRLPAILIFLLATTGTFAQPDHAVDLATLPDWMGALVSGSKPKKSAKAEGRPLHTNAFIGTWTVETDGGSRIEYWGDAHRIVLRELNGPFTLQRATLMDLRHNVKMHAHWGGAQVYAKVEDLYIPQAGYFHDIWNDSITATGRSENILGHLCQEQLGTSNGRDSSWYWTTTAYPQLFSDLKVWASWLTKGDLEHLLAFADRNAKAALRVRWGKHQYSTPAGGMEFTAITPGKAPMPELPNMAGAQLAEERLAWINNSSTGRLPAWMRAFITDLPPDSLPAAYTPPAVDRDLPNNKFIGTLTAETPSLYIGAPGKDGTRDTTLHVAKYSYWADTRRAVLILDDPDDEGYLFYAVDLDHDVVMAAHNEGHSFVIPKLEITTLENVGLEEFGRGLELDFTPQGQYRTILGRKCELYTTGERFLSHFMIPKDSVVNPVFDMRNWMVQRMGQKMKDLMFFGLAGKPMPMAVMGTHLTSYKPGKAKPPVADLGKYIVRDHRLLDQRRRNSAYEPVEEITSFEDMHIAVEPAEGPSEGRVWRGNRNRVEASPDVMLTDDPDGAITPARDAAKPMVEMPAPEGPRTGSGTGGPSARAELNPFMEGLMMCHTNRFVGTAVLRYSLTKNDGSTRKWTVHYASDSTRMVMVSRAEEALPNEHTRAYLLDRKAARETKYGLGADSTITPRNAELKRYFHSTLAPGYPDTVLAGTRKLLGRSCEKRLYETATTNRTSWVDPKTPSLFHDVVGARKHWGGIEIILLGGMVTGTAPGMPLEVDYTYQGGDHLIMKVLELKPGPVDPGLFEVTKKSWTW